jgi:hypothetical protein
MAFRRDHAVHAFSPGGWLVPAGLPYISLITPGGFTTMKTDYTHISLVLDRSGSMSIVRDDTIGGFNRFLEEQQAVPGKATFTFVLFDSSAIEFKSVGADIKNIPKLTKETYVPGDYTPLYDAIGQTIEETGGLLKNLPESERPAKVVFVVMTDGQENASRKFGVNRIREMIEHQKTQYKWEFVFLGATIDSYAVGGSIGVQPTNIMNFGPSGQSVNSAYSSASGNLRAFRTNNKADMSFTQEDKSAQLAAGVDNP